MDVRSLDLTSLLGLIDGYTSLVSKLERIASRTLKHTGDLNPLVEADRYKMETLVSKKNSAYTRANDLKVIVCLLKEIYRLKMSMIDKRGYNEDTNENI